MTNENFRTVIFFEVQMYDISSSKDFNLTFEDRQSFEARLAGGTSKDCLRLRKTLSDVIVLSSLLLFSVENTYSVVLKHQPRWTLI